MTVEKSDPADAETIAHIARIIYEQMNVEPRRMQTAITLAKQHLDDIRRVLVEQGLRSTEESGP